MRVVTLLAYGGIARFYCLGWGISSPSQWWMEKKTTRVLHLLVGGGGDDAAPSGATEAAMMARSQGAGDCHACHGVSASHCMALKTDPVLAAHRTSTRWLGTRDGHHQLVGPARSTSSQPIILTECHVDGFYRISGRRHRALCHDCRHTRPAT